MSRWILRLLLAASLLSSEVVAADEQTERRALIGIQLFPAVVAADRELDDKLAADGQLPILLVYREDRFAAEDAARRLAATGRIRGIPLRIETATYAELERWSAPLPAALMLAEWSPGDVATAAEFAIANGRILFSPFKGDVERGALAGIAISDRILPYINRRTLDASGVTLKPFLLEVAKSYE